MLVPARDLFNREFSGTDESNLPQHLQKLFLVYGLRHYTCVKMEGYLLLNSSICTSKAFCLNFSVACADSPVIYCLFSLT